MEVVIDPKDIELTTARSGGAGGMTYGNRIILFYGVEISPKLLLSNRKTCIYIYKDSIYISSLAGALER